MYVNKHFFYFLGCFFLCMSCSLHKDTEENNVQQHPAVKTVKVTMQQKENELASFGTITYKTKHDISALVAGSVKQLFIKEGDYVRKNQILAVLRNVQMEIQKEQYENTLSSAKASLAIAEAKLREEQLNIESKLLSIEKKELSIKQEKIEYENAEQTYKNNKELHEIGGITEIGRASCRERV